MQLSGIAHQIWADKYRFKNNEGEPIDITVEDTWRRIARALASVEQPNRQTHFEDEFLAALADFNVIPAGRIIAGAGTGRSVTLINCYVMGTVPDSLAGIHATLGETAISMQQGAGTGTDFSTLRPAGALITKLGSTASGPLPFMDNWDSMCRTIMSAGHRRGAMMGTMRCDHPDIEAFIEAKRDAKRFRNFNLSVLVTDKFMDAVKRDGNWLLEFGGVVYKTMPARDLWAKIMRSTYDFADPGVIFIDRVNDANPLQYCETISCTNPCGEQPMPPYGSCCLGSINLTRFVIDPFTANARINFTRLERAAMVLYRMLDNVLDVSNYPLPAQKHESQQKRRVGVGITGFADMLAMMGIAYSSPSAAKLAGDVTEMVHRATEEASIQIGEEKGSFPLYDAEQYRSLTGVKAKYRRSSHTTSIAPTGTISLFAGNISSGIEPIFDLELRRKILQPDHSFKEVVVRDYAYEQARRYGGNVPMLQQCMPTVDGHVWETTAQLSPKHHLAVLAACRPWVDSSISKTINCPKSITFEEFQDIYLEAYSLGAKSCTTYRPNEVTGSILSSDTMSVSSPAPVSNVVELTKPLTRPDQLHGTTYKLKPPKAQHALFITINDVVEDSGRRRPFEIFINTKNLEFLAWSTALTRMISAIFRRGGNVAFITEELSEVFDPHGGGYWANNRYVPSIIAGIGMIIRDHLDGLGIDTPKPVQAASKPCPECSGVTINKEGCWSCTTCSYSACG